jgi:hypothetical protein
LTELSLQEQQAFAKAPVLFMANAEVNKLNFSMLEKVNEPVARIVAQYVGMSQSEGSKIDADMFQNLKHELYLYRMPSNFSCVLKDSVIGHVDKERVAAKRPMAH